MKQILSTLAQKWPEYLLEILVITIGILGAFALNNWNESRKDRIEELVLLKQLLNEYESNLNQLESKINTRNALIKSSKELLSFFEYPDTVKLDDVVPRIANLALTVTYDPIKNDLFASGNINRITNPKLKSLLTSWSTDVIQVQEVETIYLQRFNNHIQPFLIELGLGRSIDESFWQSIQQLDFMLGKNEINTYDYGASRFTPSVKELLNNMKLEGYVSNSIMASDFINLESYTLKKQIEEIIELLRQELTTN